MDTNRKNELAEKIADAAIEQMDMKDVIAMAHSAVVAEYIDAEDGDVREACIDYDIDCLAEYNLAYYESEDHAQKATGQIPDEYRQYWSCWAEDYEHAVEQLLDAEPEARQIDQAD